jgi:hypothetical protein
MGSILSSLWGKLFNTEKNYNILIVGLANAGKTTLLYRMYELCKSGLWEKLLKLHQQSEVMLSKSPIKM